MRLWRGERVGARMLRFLTIGSTQPFFSFTKRYIKFSSEMVWAYPNEIDQYGPDN